MKRMRMVAGPNGSGKSTLLEYLRKTFPLYFLGPYVNADDLKRALDAGSVSLDAFGVGAQAGALASFLARHPLLADDTQPVGLIQSGEVVAFEEPTPYHAAALADFVRTALLGEGVSFACETVMSHSSKLRLLDEARASGYRTYLYFVATDDPLVNIDRVHQRVASGGHPVPEDKIVSRYHRALALLPEALMRSDRAFVFDNSGESPIWVAEVVHGREVTVKVKEMPRWFQSAVVRS